MVELRQRQHIVDVSPRFRRRRRLKRLSQTDVINYELGVRVPARELPKDRRLARAQHVDRNTRLRARLQDEIESGIVGRNLLKAEHDPSANHARLRGPLLDFLRNRRRMRIERFDQPKPVRMLLVHREHVAGVVAIDRERRDQQRPIDANRIHRRDHVVAGDLLGPGQERAPGILRSVAFIGMDLAIDGWCRHD